MSKPIANLLTVFPGRKDSKIADASELCTTSRVTRQSSNGDLYTICEYTGKNISYKTTSAPRKRMTYSPEPTGPKPKVAKPAVPITRSPAKTRAKPIGVPRGKTPKTTSPLAKSSPAKPRVASPLPAPAQSPKAPTPLRSDAATPEVPIPVTLSPPATSSEPERDELASGDNTLLGSFNLSGDGISEFDEALFDNLDIDESLEKSLEKVEPSKEDVERIRGMYSSGDALPVRFMGKLAIEYDNFDFETVCEQITSLTCFNKLHEESLVPLLKLADRDVTKRLSTVNIKKFYKHELIPAMENLKLFKEDPDKFHDKHKGQFELYIEDDRIVEVPLPPRPQIFPHQLRNIDLASIADIHNEESEKRFLEEEKRIQEEEQRRQNEAQRVAHHRASMNRIYQQYRPQLGLAAFMNPFVYPNANQNNIPFFPHMPFPPNFYGSAYNPQMFP